MRNNFISFTQLNSGNKVLVIGAIIGWCFMHEDYPRFARVTSIEIRTYHEVIAFTRIRDIVESFVYCLTEQRYNPALPYIFKIRKMIVE